MKLQKSQFLSFSRCSKSYELGAWEKKNKPFPDISVSLEWEQFLNLCRQKIETHESCIANPPEWKVAMESEQLYCKVEAICRNASNGVLIWDFRPVVHVKKDWLRGIYFQTKTIESLSLVLSSFQIYTINPDCFLGSDLDFLVVHDALALIKKNQGWLEADWNKFVSYTQNPNSIPVEELPSCNSPKGCFLPDQCFGKPEERNVFLLRDSAQIAKAFWLDGKRDWEQIPEKDLSRIQKIQRECHIQKTPYFDLQLLEKFLPSDEDKLVFLDFETINPVFPVYKNTKPFQHIPFLFSIHNWDQKQSEPHHFVFSIIPSKEDPRQAILTALKDNIPIEAKILSYNAFFEKKVISESVQIFPEFQDFWDSIQNQFVDLAHPFRSMWVYHPKQNGSASLKDILPAFTDLSYNELEVKGGQEANFLLLKCLLTEMDQSEKEKILKDLVHYCTMDTYAIYLLFKILKDKIKEQK